jgi:twinkle protein
MDVTELVQAGRSRDATNAVFHPDPFRPDGIVSLTSLEAEMLNPVVVGRPYAIKAQTEWTYGKRPGEVTVLGAGTGIGKSDWMIQDAAHTLAPALPLEASPLAWVNGVYSPIAVFNYEAGPAITGKALLGKLFQKRFHIPDDDDVLWTKAELEEAMAFYKEQCAKCFINDHQGAVNWEGVKERLRYLKHTEGIVQGYIDPMAALVATEDDERKALDRMMAEAKMLAEELQIGLHFNSHLTRPSDGPSHEEGGRVTLKNFRGSNAIGMWASFVWGLERNQQADDPEERAVTTLRSLKDRYTGNSTGKTTKLIFNQLTGMLETPADPMGDPEGEVPESVAPAEEIPE